jgi:hypothetical protein
MSFPFFPTLTPPIASSLWFDTSCICDEEAEINKEEQEHRANVKSINFLLVVDFFNLLIFFRWTQFKTSDLICTQSGKFQRKQ